MKTDWQENKAKLRYHAWAKVWSTGRQIYRQVYVQISIRVCNLFWSVVDEN